MRIGISFANLNVEAEQFGRTDPIGLGVQLNGDSFKVILREKEDIQQLINALTCVLDSIETCVWTTPQVIAVRD